MKRLYFYLQFLTIVFVLCMTTISCSKDDDYKEDDYEKTENLSNQDPEGTIVLNMTSGAKDNYYHIGDLGEIHIDAANNFRSNNSNTSFVSVGLVGGLSKITQIPKSGWADGAAVVPGTGYVMRYGYNSYQYARIYVVEYLGSTYTDGAGNTYGEITGAKIKYQVPFQLPIKLDITSLSFDSGADSKTIELVNPTTITIEEKPNWCEVFFNSETMITIKVTENLTAEQRQGDIVLKNTSNSVKISITQKGASSPMFQAGSGTAEDPYQIKTAQQLKSITKALNAHFILTADITLNEEVNGSGWDPIGKQETPFTGTLNGQGHTIKNLWMKRPTTDGVGLFGYASYSTIKELCVEIGSNGLNGGNNVGTIVGFATNVNIEQCGIKGTISGNQNVGGICGNGIYQYDYYYSGNMAIEECYSEGNISGNDHVAGILGNNDDCTICNCYSTANLSANYYCYGISSQGVTKCYYAGTATPRYYKFRCPGTYTYFDSSVIGTGKYENSNNARTTAQMKTQSNYEGWDFTNIWKITESKTYPTLRCFDK